MANNFLNSTALSRDLFDQMLAGRKLALTRPELTVAGLGGPHRIRELEQEGLLHPRRLGSTRGRKVYLADEVLSLLRNLPHHITENTVLEEQRQRAASARAKRLARLAERDEAEDADAEPDLSPAA
jgi:hypothetical protein